MAKSKKNSLFMQFTMDAFHFRIIDFLIDNKGMDFTKKDIAAGAEISRASLFGYWHTLEYYDLVKPTRAFGRTVLYTLNTESPITKKLLELESTLIRQAMMKKHEEKELLVTH